MCAPVSEDVKCGRNAERVVKCEAALTESVLVACSGVKVSVVIGDGKRGRPVIAVAALLTRIVGDPSCGYVATVRNPDQQSTEPRYKGNVAPEKSHLVDNLSHCLLDLVRLTHVDNLPHQIPPLHLLLRLLIWPLDIQHRDLDALPEEHLCQDSTQPRRSARDDHDLFLPLDLSVPPVRHSVVDPDANFHDRQECRIVQRIVSQGLAVFVNRGQTQIKDKCDPRMEDRVGEDHEEQVQRDVPVPWLRRDEPRGRGGGKFGCRTRGNHDDHSLSGMKAPHNSSSFFFSRS